MTLEETGVLLDEAETARGQRTRKAPGVAYIHLYPLRLRSGD